MQFIDFSNSLLPLSLSRQYICMSYMSVCMCAHVCVCTHMYIHVHTRDTCVYEKLCNSWTPLVYSCLSLFALSLRYLCMYTHVFKYESMYMCVHTCVYMCTYVHTCVRMYHMTHVFKGESMYMCVHTCVYMCTYVHTCVRMYHMCVHGMMCRVYGIM